MGKSKDLATGASYQDQTESDARYVNAVGDTVTGALYLNTTLGSRQLDITGVEADIWLNSTGPNKTWRILGSTGSNTHKLRFYDQSNAAERMAIDESGRVTMPYQPAFQAWATAGTNEHFAGGTNPSFGAIGTNVGNHFNGTTFTAPVAGRYFFAYSILSGSAGDYGLIALHVNGSPAVGSQNWSQHYTSLTNDQQNSSQQILTLAANDQVNLYIHTTYNHFYWSGNYSKFGGYLIG